MIMEKTNQKDECGKTTSAPHNAPARESILEFACTIEMAGWIMSRENVESLDEIKLNITEQGDTFVTCFFNCRSHSELDHDQVIEYRSDHPEEFRREVKKGLAKLNACLNGLLWDKQKCSALNRKEAGR